MNDATKQGAHALVDGDLARVARSIVARGLAAAQTNISGDTPGSHPGGFTVAAVQRSVEVLEANTGRDLRRLAADLGALAFAIRRIDGRLASVEGELGALRELLFRAEFDAAAEKVELRDAASKCIDDISQKVSSLMDTFDDLASKVSAKNAQL